MKKFLKITFINVTVLAIIALSLIVWYLSVTANTVFDESKLNFSSQSCVVYDKDGKEFKDSRKRTYVAGDNIPETVKNAFIAVEDKRFYTHGGIDLKGMLRATKNNIFSGKIVEGGSTISQQLVKNVFLSGEKTINRKFNEIKLTRELERRYGKDKILEMYLNSVYFGKGIYGVADASLAFFGKEIKSVSLGEAAVLAAVVKSPKKYNPVDNKQNANERKNVVLKLLKEQNYISDKEYKKEKNIAITANYTKDYVSKNVEIQEVKRNACEILGFDNESELNDYKIYTSLDRSVSEYVSSPETYKLDCDYTVIIADAETGKITGFKTSYGDIPRCPASTAKPWLIYSPCIDEGIVNEATKIFDEKTNFGGYSPSNYGDKYYGYTSVKNALSKSLNVPSVKLAETLGTDKIVKNAENFGVKITNTDLSVALGNIDGGITLCQLVSCYTPFANDGKYSEVSFIEKIVNPKGKTVYLNKKETKQIIKPSTAFIINDILCETVKSGTAKKLNDLPFPVYAKTGTNGNKEGNKDAYCIAYTTEHIVGVWLGNSDDKNMDNSVSGGTYPTMIAKDVLVNLYKNHKPEAFGMPDSVEYLYIDKNAYNDDNEILLRDSDGKDSIGFYFSSENKPEKKVTEAPVTPAVKDYKITYKNGKISISIITEEGVGFYLFDGSGKELLKSAESGKYVMKDVKQDTEYSFFVKPFMVSDGVEVCGEIIKLPSVKTDGGLEKIKNSPWWE